MDVWVEGPAHPPAQVDGSAPQPQRPAPVLRPVSPGPHPPPAQQWAPQRLAARLWQREGLGPRLTLAFVPRPGSAAALEAASSSALCFLPPLSLPAQPRACLGEAPSILSALEKCSRYQKE